MTRVLMINTDYSRGGTARVAYGLHEYLLNSPDIYSIFLSGRGVGLSRQRIVALRQSYAHEYINALAYRISATEGMFSANLWKKIVEQNFFHADIIHLHNVHGYYLPNSVIEIIKQYPVVWTMHDHWIATGRCAFPLECRGWEQSCECCPCLKKYPSAWFRRNYKKDFVWKRQLLNSFTKLVIVVPSNTFFKQLSYFGVMMRNVKVIHNGIDTNIFKPLSDISEKNILMNKLRLPKDKIQTLCFIANKLNAPRKGFDVFYKAIISLDRKIRLITIGECAKEIYTLKFPNNIDVIHLGHISDKNLLSDYIKISDVMVNSSEEETFGLTSLESLSCGVRPIVFNLPIFQEILKDWAIFSKESDYISLKESILKSLESPFSFQKKKEAYSYVRKNFSLEKMCKSYEELYGEINAKSYKE